MYPWFWMTPHLHFPFSGDLSQNIAPQTRWFEEHIAPDKKNGDADVERAAFGIASYGKQLGLLTEVLLRSIGDPAISPEVGDKALVDLKKIHDKIELLKLAHRDDAAAADDIAQRLTRLQSADPGAYRALQQRFFAMPPA